MAGVMPKKARKRLGRYLRDIADQLELRDWTVTHRWSQEPANPNHGADNECIYGQKVVIIRFRYGFENWDPVEQRATIVHELMHATRAATWDQVRGDLDGVLGRQADELFTAAYGRQMEYEVEALAQAFARHMPLPDLKG